MDSLFILATLILIAFAAKDIGKGSQQFGLPLISGYLLAGILVGPYVLGVFDRGDAERVRFVEQAALAFIALAAGGELHLQAVRGHLRSIVAIIAGQTIAVLVLVTVAVVALAGSLPFMEGMSSAAVFAPAVLAATIMVARSPSSAYAIIKELHARGPFTQKVLGVTVLKDAVVILIFASAGSIAHSLLTGARFDFGLITVLVFDILLDIALGVAAGHLITGLFSSRLPDLGKAAALLFIGYGVFHVSDLLRGIPLGPLPVRICSEPLLVCMTAGFVTSNFTRYRAEFQKVVEGAAPLVFILFFTLVGLSLELHVLRETWSVALILLLVRLAGIFLGSFAGGMATGDPARQSVILGMAFLTQAGVSIGLAKEVAVSFPPWGNDLATLCIAVIVANQIIGPPLFKWALHLVHEAHPRHAPTEIDSAHKVMLFGIDGLSLALARRLRAEGWDLQLVDPDPSHLPQAQSAGVEAHALRSLTLEGLRELGAEHAGTIVAMLPSEDDNFRLCQLTHDHFGTTSLIARVHDKSHTPKFRDLGVQILDPGAALVNLLEILVRSPSTTHLLLGHDAQQKVDEILVHDPLHENVALRDLELPTDVLVLSVRRGDELLISHGYTRLKTGDVVTIVGSEDSLRDVRLLLCA